MNISHNNIDTLNSVLTVSIEKSDYKDKVEKSLNEYRKHAAVKGFRKGHVPMSYVRKQFEKSVIFDEVNSLLQTGINDFIRNEKISILGNPLPKEQQDFDWDADPLKFEFEMGLAPEVNIDLSKIKVDTYKIKVEEDEISKYVDNFQKKFGSIKYIDKVEDKGEINIKVKIKELDKDKNPIEGGIEEETFVFTDELVEPKKFYGKKVGDTVIAKIGEVSNTESKIENLFGLTPERQKDFDGFFEMTITEISVHENAPLNQDLYDKIYGEGTIMDEKGFRERIKEESEKMYERSTDSQMVSDTIETLISETKFDLPNDFLSRWLYNSDERIESVEQATEQLKKEEKALRFQLIESKISEIYDLKVNYEEVLDAIRDDIRNRMAMYGNFNLGDHEIENIVQTTIKNETEFRRMSEQVLEDKMKKVFKENIKFNVKEIDFDGFMKIIKEKQHHNHDHDHNHSHVHHH